MKDELIDESRYPVAPSRRQIGKISDTLELWDVVSDCEDHIISIVTQLEYLDTGDFPLKNARVSALISWKIAKKDAINRLNLLKADKARADKAAA